MDSYTSYSYVTRVNLPQNMIHLFQVLTSPGKPVAAINIDAIVAFRELGKGYESLRTFPAFMKMPTPMTSKNLNYLTKKLYKAYATAAIQSTTRVALQTRKSLCYS